MPNWCTNRLDVIGEKGAIKDFLDAITNPDFLVNADELTEEQVKAYRGVGPHGHEERKDVWNEYDLTLPYPTPDILVGTRSPASTQEKVDQMRVDILAEDAPVWLTEERIAEEQSYVAQGVKAKAETGFIDWYTWNIAHWGTKWSPNVETLSLEDGELTIQYETAWAPAQELLEELSNQHRSLVFIETYVEEGMGFFGSAIYRNGTREEDSYREISSDTIMDSLHATLNKAIEAEDEATEDSLYQAINDRWQLIVTRNAEDMKALAKSELVRVQ